MNNMKKVNYGSYIVYEDGSCYSHYTNKFLKPSKDKIGYLSYTLFEKRGT